MEMKIGPASTAHPKAKPACDHEDTPLGSQKSNIARVRAAIGIGKPRV